MTTLKTVFVLCKTVEGFGRTSNRYIAGRDGKDYTHRSENAKTWKTRLGVAKWRAARGGCSCYPGYEIVEIVERD